MIILLAPASWALKRVDRVTIPPFDVTESPTPAPVPTAAVAAIQAPIEYTIGASSMSGGGAMATIGAPLSGVMSSDFFTIESGFMAYANQVGTASREEGGETQEFIAGQTTDLTINSNVTNSYGVPQAMTFSATLPDGLTALPGSCVASVGVCTIVSVPATVSIGGRYSKQAVTRLQVSWTGTLGPFQTVTISYRVQLSGQPVSGSSLCINSSTSLGGVQQSSGSNCIQVSQPTGPGNNLAASSATSAVKSGSVLIYPLYASSANPASQDSRITITNTDSRLPVNVHLFFVDGDSCSVADQYLTLSRNQTVSFLASDQDPGITGYVVAVAVDELGCPIRFNSLIGNAWVRLESGHRADLPALAVAALPGGTPPCDQNTTAVTLAFDGLRYNQLPRTLAIDNLAPKAEGNETMLVLTRVSGNLATGANTLGTIFGLLYDDVEVAASFTLPGGRCQVRGLLGNNFPRTVPRYDRMIPAGRSGWMKLWAEEEDGLLGAVLNSNPGRFGQGHLLHTLTTTATAYFRIPVYPVS